MPPTPAPTASALPSITSASGDAASSATEFFQQDDAALAQAWGVQPPPAEAVTEVEDTAVEDDSPYKDAIAPDTKETVPTDDEGTEAGAETKEVELPKADRKLMTDFKIHDTEGELEIPEIQIEFKAKGEVRKLPLDHVVRLAQFGFANEEREQQVLAAKHFVAEAQQKEQTYQQNIQQYEGYYDRIFNDPAFYEEARLAYLNQHTPEAQAQRLVQENQQLRRVQQEEHEKQQLAGFVHSNLTPAVTRLIEGNPLVSEKEVIERYQAVTAPLLVNGRVPLNRLRDVQYAVQNDLALWVQQTQMERASAKRASDTQVARATQQVAAAKRQTARVFAQPGRMPDSTQKPTKFDSARNWLDATFPAPSE